MIHIELNEKLKNMLSFYEIESSFVNSIAKELNVDVKEYTRDYINHKIQKKQMVERKNRRR
jgi:hypothetical protein